MRFTFIYNIRAYTYVYLKFSHNSKNHSSNPHIHTLYIYIYIDFIVYMPICMIKLSKSFLLFILNSTFELSIVHLHEYIQIKYTCIYTYFYRYYIILHLMLLHRDIYNVYMSAMINDSPFYLVLLKTKFHFENFK